MSSFNHLSLNNDIDCFIFVGCVNPKQTPWLVLAGYVVMLNVCMQLCFKHKISKAFACVFKPKHLITIFMCVCFE